MSLSCEVCEIHKANLSWPDLLALLPLRRLAAATLRERPVPLRRDEVALHALHLERLLPPIDL